MFDRIKFNGYRLLDGFEADLGQLTVAIGANGTGKSTILNALMLITKSLEWPLEEVLTRQGGLYSILSRTGRGQKMGWEVSIRKPQTHPLWSQIPVGADMPLVFEGCVQNDPTHRINLVHECLRNAEPYQGYSHPLKLLDVRGNRALIYDQHQKKLLPFNDPASASEAAATAPAHWTVAEAGLPTPQISLLLSQMRFINAYPIPTWIRSFLASSYYYPGFDVSPDSPVRTKLAEVKPQTVLNMNGDNLGTVLHEILTRHEYRDSARELQDFLAVAYPHVMGVSAETSYGGEPRLLVRVLETGFLRPTEIWELSDGMLRFLLLCAALLNPVPPGMIAIDEPEAGLHPKLLPVIADMIRSASERCQVLITTHSPELLNCFSLHDVAVVTREDGRAKWHRPGNHESLHRMLEAEVGGTLGELHASGELEAMS